jgi:hypothetical protein
LVGKCSEFLGSTVVLNRAVSRAGRLASVWRSSDNALVRFMTKNLYVNVLAEARIKGLNRGQLCFCELMEDVDYTQLCFAYSC